MHVLDLGCGIGELSLMAARLVGRQGTATAIDIDQKALAIAADRALEQALGNLQFVQGSIDQYQPGRSFDAVIGRHILIHSRDPLAIVSKAYEWLSPGGVAAFQEYDFSTAHAAYPPLPLRDRLMTVFRDFFGAVSHGNIGTQLPHLLLETGFRAPNCRVEYPMDVGPDSPFYEWIAESFRSIAQRAAAIGLVKEFEFNLDTLEQQLRQEAAPRNASFPGPTMAGCFARKPLRENGHRGSANRGRCPADAQVGRAPANDSAKNSQRVRLVQEYTDMRLFSKYPDGARRRACLLPARRRCIWWRQGMTSAQHREILIVERLWSGMPRAAHAWCTR
jgi:SAM-dependent methyltransferase